MVCRLRFLICWLWVISRFPISWLWVIGRLLVSRFRVVCRGWSRVVNWGRGCIFTPL